MEEKQITFCPFCGSRYGKTDTNPLKCDNCLREYYFNPHPCNAAIIENSRGEILFVRRRIDPHQGMLDLPGGFIAPEETAEKSMEREIGEELGAGVKNLAYFSSTYDRYLYEGVNYHTICLFYRVTLVEGALKAADDVASYTYISKKDIPFEEIAFEGIKRILKEYLRKFPPAG